MAVGVEKEWIVPAVIVAFKLQKLRSPRVGASEAQGEHGGLAAGIGETNNFRGGHHATDTLPGFDLGGSCRGKVRAFGSRLRNGLNNSGMGVSLDERAERHHEVQVFVAVCIPDVRTAAL